MMGSGGMIVLDDKSCMVDIAKFYIDFMVDESCGKCTPCREGTIQMYEILNNITSGKATLEDLDLLEELAISTVNTSLCGLGQTAPNPILSTLQYFKHEYIDHIENKKCEASVCKDLISKYVITDACTGCTLCAQNCPVQCISGDRKEQHIINNDACILCGDCFSRCPFDAIVTE
jgi:NADH-quinone oxidoreductase subunit F/NADP-reducing hydrogenase subunit HndC